jgi:hypothetical protein
MIVVRISAGVSREDARTEIDEILARIHADCNRVRRIRKLGSEQVSKFEEIQSQISTTEEDRVNYSPRIIRAVKYTLFQRYGMLLEEEKGRAKHLFGKLPSVLRHTPCAKDVAELAKQAGIHL